MSLGEGEHKEVWKADGKGRCENQFISGNERMKRDGDRSTAQNGAPAKSRAQACV